jgi:hypothetical protein
LDFYEELGAAFVRVPLDEEQTAAHPWALATEPSAVSLALARAATDLGAHVFTQEAPDLGGFRDAVRLQIFQVHGQLQPHGAVWVLGELDRRVVKRLRVGGPDRDSGTSDDRPRVDQQWVGVDGIERGGSR